MTAVAPVVIDCDGLWVGWTGLDNFNTGYSFSELLIFASLNLKHDNRFFIELKFGLSEKCAKFEKIFLMVLTNQLIYLVNVKTIRKIISNYVCFSESPNFTSSLQAKLQLQ